MKTWPIFWETHSLADYWDQTEPADFEAVAAQTTSDVVLRRRLAEADVVFLPLRPVRGFEGEVFTGALTDLYKLVKPKGQRFVWKLRPKVTSPQG